MHLTQKQQLILAIVIFGITGYVLYSTFFKTSAPVPGVSVSEDGTVTSVSANQDIIDLSNKLDEMSVNIDLFGSALFKNLRDLEVPLTNEDSGRPNPFAPIGVDNASTQTTSVSTTTIRRAP